MGGGLAQHRDGRAVSGVGWLSLGRLRELRGLLGAIPLPLSPLLLLLPGHVRLSKPGRPLPSVVHHARGRQSRLCSPVGCALPLGAGPAARPMAVGPGPHAWCYGACVPSPPAPTVGPGPRAWGYCGACVPSPPAPTLLHPQLLRAEP